MNDGQPEGGTHERLSRRFERERKARLEAEAIAERSIRDLYEKQREVELLLSIAAASNESSELGEAIQAALDRVCEHTGWPVGNAYLVATDGSEELAPGGIWHLEDKERFETFRRITQATRFPPGVGLPGRVWLSGEPAWIMDVNKDNNFPRAQQARDIGVKAGFGFPVLAGKEVVAVLEFFSPEAVPPDERLLKVMANVGTQLGRVIERRRAEETVSYLAYHDALTGLPNRSLFEDRFTVALAQAQRHQQRLAVLSLDLDRFKLVNDTLGHAAGDHLLREVAQRLGGIVRAGDSFARVGGDEFLLLLPRSGPAEEVAKMADRILSAFGGPFVFERREFHATTSIGISMYPHDGEDAQTLIKSADAALYRAKELGRGNYQLYTPAMNVRASERLGLENDLRRALEREEFVIYYQPQIGVETGQIVGVEALVRWQHPARGLVLPEEFIPAAEETGLIVPLGCWVLRTACAQMKAWQNDGVPPFRLAVNLSMRQFHQPDFVRMVAEVLRDTGLDPRYLELEITESIAMRDAAFTAQILRRLRDSGIRVAIDDFGTGYSSLKYLKDLPIDGLKIDRSFISDLQSDTNDATIASNIIAIGHSLGLNVIAEGVETEEQLAFLRERQCDEFQGFIWARPMPARSLGELFGRQPRQPGTEPPLSDVA
jgi:diguanylate cyclase (GGDEF)-like protein